MSAGRSDNCTNNETVYHSIESPMPTTTTATANTTTTATGATTNTIATTPKSASTAKTTNKRGYKSHVPSACKVLPQVFISFRKY